MKSFFGLGLVKFIPEDKAEPAPMPPPAAKDTITVVLGQTPPAYAGIYRQASNNRDDSISAQEMEDYFKVSAKRMHGVKRDEFGKPVQRVGVSGAEWKAMKKKLRPVKKRRA
jgi:hypothetical protein